MKIYQWTAFDTAYPHFEVFASTDKYEANKKAWDRYHNLVEKCRENNELDAESEDEVAKDIVEFCSSEYHYFYYRTSGTWEMEYHEIEV